MIRFFKLLGKATTEFSRDQASHLAAGLSYYAIFSLVPILIIAINIAERILGPQAVAGELQTQIEGWVGPDASGIIQAILVDTANRPGSDIITTLLGLAALWWAATNLFSRLRQALNKIWDLKPPPTDSIADGVWVYLRERFLAIVMVIAVGIMLAFSVVMLTFIGVMNERLQELVPNFLRLAPSIDLGLTLFLLFVLCAIVYQFLPHTDLHWSDVTIGASFTAAIMGLSKFLIGQYMSNRGFNTAYGAAGSLVILMVWVYYSAQVFLLGAEFTKVYARTFGSHRPRREVMPALNAIGLNNDDTAWPSLSASTRGEENAGNHILFQLRLWLGAALAFFVGLFVGAKKGN